MSPPPKAPTSLKQSLEPDHELKFLRPVYKPRLPGHPLNWAIPATAMSSVPGPLPSMTK